ncbi:RagB/SusD family nutrient uptake outer membrane protein [Albibacterium bauzanense]|uniref:Putative outer membrane starch-binding protein n=1 Tax=Albibacterium bauzanense TaxID=653929 RepID=A0A4R1M0N6_9SPHI|nr:RagB/SusD family nutrient uptake outer membrane protein [Albibacterium bauzanense]TCK83193.1 putative outer membrane starch-binding protein [Albibacterium bauzanense]
MKHNYLLIVTILAFGLITSCKKDPAPKPDPEPDPGTTIVDDRPPEKVVEALTTELAKVEDVSEFAEALKNVVLTQEEVSQGLTIFAPLNSQRSAPQAIASRFSNRTMVASASQERFSNRLSAEVSEPVELTDAELRDHIVKGVYKLADLADGTVLITLSGKSLKIKKEGDQTWINGVKMNEGTVSADGKQTIFVVNEPLTGTEVTDEPAAPSGIEVTVWDATEWSPENSMGKVASGAQVAIYRTQLDYANDNPLFEEESDAQGKVTFNNVEPGIYYIVATKGDMSNIFYKNKNPGDELFTGMVSVGIFQTQGQMDAAAANQSKKLGNFEWMDMNGDGVINNDDRVTLPAESVDIEEGNIVPISILIGYSDNDAMGPLRRESQVLDFLTGGYINITDWLSKEIPLLDGVLSDDSDAPQDGYSTYLGMPAIDNFTFLATNVAINQLWNVSYGNISNLNKLIRDVPNVNMANKNQVLAQARALRAAIYIQLMTYYGNVPIQNDVVMEAGIVNSSKQEVYEYIKQELTEIQNDMPGANTGNLGQLNNLFTSALLSKAALANKDYTLAAAAAAEVINSNKYVLESSNTAFTQTSKETIWGYPSQFTNEFRAYFFGRTFSPVIRLSEIYLIAAEANIQTGNVQKAIGYLNPILQSNSLPSLLGTESTGALNNALRNVWKTSMPREGLRFANLVRWGIASEVLGNKGFNASKHNLLPIPQVTIDRFSGITQNPGY